MSDEEKHIALLAAITLLTALFISRFKPLADK